MQRRDLIRFSLAATAAGALLPGAASAMSSSRTCDSPNPMAGGMFYTKDAPGRWRGKEGSHSPNMEIERKPDGISVKIVTGHEMNGFGHYIVKHILLDKDYGFLGEKMFDPAKDMQAISTFELKKDYTGQIHALSVCNKHDTWLGSMQVE